MSRFLLVTVLAAPLALAACSPEPTTPRFEAPADAASAEAPGTTVPAPPAEA